MCASGPVQLSNTTPTRLIQSSGNLYWSSNPREDTGDTASVIYRASKSSRPGEEVQLYTETGVDFEALTFAEVDGEFYGYFVANYNNNPVGGKFGLAVSQIKRIPLAGGPAVVLANSPAPIGLGDLVTDGSFLCWADSEGIRSMPIGGGPVRTLVAGGGFARLSVPDGTLYYIGQPGNPQAIFSVPIRGGSPSNVIYQPVGITALHVNEARPLVALAERPETPGPPPTPRPGTAPAVVWGTPSGGVSSKFVVGRATATYEPIGSFTGPVLSVYSDDTRVLWLGGAMNRYRVSMARGVDAVTTLTEEPNSRPLPLWDVLADDVAAYWTDTFVEKYTF